MIFVDDRIKEFQYNYEEEKNKFIVAFFTPFYISNADFKLYKKPI
jgi:hypothetical protein